MLLLSKSINLKLKANNLNLDDLA